jgi:hypothetical protein
MTDDGIKMGFGIMESIGQQDTPHEVRAESGNFHSLTAGSIIRKKGSNISLFYRKMKLLSRKAAKEPWAR